MNNMDRKAFLKNCHTLQAAFKDGSLGNVDMPEDSSPDFADTRHEERLTYFTLPMALNYQRNSYTLWESALKTWEDADTRDAFDIRASATMSEDELRKMLMKYKVALQPNKHIATWHKISQTIASEWGSISALMKATENDYLKLRDIIQGTHKKGFPYLSGPKIFNYWSFIISSYGKVPLKNKASIEIAPDTHVTKGSVLLGVISSLESENLSKEIIAARWRELLDGSDICPSDMHSPLWFWSKNGFGYQLR